MRLVLDHLILRAADPAATLAELSQRTGAPVLAEVEEVAGMASGIVRAGSLDIEVLRIGAEPPERTLGYGAGFTADVPLEEATAAIRELGFPTSAPASASASGRKWRAVQVHGLLPRPLKVPGDHASRPGSSTASPASPARIPGAARMAATRTPATRWSS